MIITGRGCLPGQSNGSFGGIVQKSCRQTQKDRSSKPACQFCLRQPYILLQPGTGSSATAPRCPVAQFSWVTFLPTPPWCKFPMSCSVANVLFSALTLSVAIIALHGAMRVPDDLFLDETDVSGAGAHFQNYFLHLFASNASSSWLSNSVMKCPLVKCYLLMVCLIVGLTRELLLRGPPSGAAVACAAACLQLQRTSRPPSALENKRNNK